MTDDDLTKLARRSVDTAEADAIASLSNALEALRDARNEERFIWIVVTIVLFDAMIFAKIESWSGPIVIGLVQLILLVVAARRLGIQEVSQILAKFLDRAADITQAKAGTKADRASPPPPPRPGD
ncbi:MAG: hypothetical protein JWM75_1157 [Sphingomonas bacterium]|nr:hypothetical protein [Sphingomonas bacterium]